MITRAFGLGLDFETTPPGAWRECPVEDSVLHVRDAGTEEIAAAWSGVEEVGWEATIDGAPFVVERGIEGDYRFVHGEASVHLLAADGNSLRCAWGDEDDPARWRVVLDSVLFSIALLRGREAVHCGALVSDSSAVAVVAASGGGKSTLLAELLGRGDRLLSDDVLILEPAEAGPPLAHPGPPLMTLPASIDRLGDEIATVADERWVAVPTAVDPVPLAAIFILDRRPGLTTGVQRVVDPWAWLMSSLLRFPRTEERERSRFEIAGAIAAEVPVWGLSADSGVEPAALADMVQAGLAGEKS